MPQGDIQGIHVTGEIPPGECFYVCHTIDSVQYVTPLAAKISPPDCFLYAAHPLRVRIPFSVFYTSKIKRATIR